MTPASAHTALLLLASLAALAATIVSAARRRSLDASPGVGDDAISLTRIGWALWPFAALACFELLQLRTSGTLVEEWLYPALATLAAVLFATSASTVRWVRRAMILTAVVLTLHGGLMLSKDYVAHSPSLRRGQVESRWYTPFTGIKAVVRPR